MHMALRLALLALAAWFVASGIGSLVGESIAVDVAVPDRSPLRSAPPGPTAEAIFAGGLFERDPPRTGRCADGIDLVGTVASGDAATSLAAIRTPGGTRLHRVGESVGGVRVDQIGWREVVLGGAEGCTLAMFEARPPQVVGRSDDDVREVDRVEIDRILADPRAIQRLGRIVLRPDGLQIRGIRRGSPLDRMGLQSGDVLVDLDGFSPLDPSIPAQTLHALEDGEISIRFRRGTEIRGIRYRIR